MPALFLMMAFIGIETWGIVKVVHKFGPGFTLAWLGLAMLAGAWLIKQGGITAFRRIQAALNRNELPTADIFAGIVLAFAGLLFILPGIVTDVIGMSLLLGGAAMRKRLGERLSEQMGAARPDLKKPVTLEGEFQRKSDTPLGKR